MTTNRSCPYYRTLILAAAVLALASLACSAIVTPTPGPAQATPPSAAITQPPPTATPPGATVPGATAESLDPEADTAPSESPISLAEAMDQNVAEIRILGTGAASGNSITIIARRIGDRLATIRVDPGTVLLSSAGNEQDMVVRRLLGWRVDQNSYNATEFITLFGPQGAEQHYAVEAYCLDFHKDNPGSSTSFSIGDPAPAAVQAVLDAVEQLPAAAEDVAVVQAAVWAVTDDVTGPELASRGYEPDQESVRSILQTAGLDPACYALFGGACASPAAVPPSPAEASVTPPAGGVWQPILDLPRQINALVVDPNDPQIVYAGTGSSGAGSGVFKSQDAGLTWQKAASGLPSEDVRALGFSRTDPATLYATAGHRGDVFASTDGAQSWMRLGNYELSGFQARLSVAPSDPNVLFVTEDVRGVYRSLDGGRTWLEVGEGLPRDQNDAVKAQSLAIDPADANVVYLGTGWGSFNGNGVYKSTDGGETWAPANRGMMDYGITALAVNPAESQVVYAGGNGSELFKSGGGGETWTDLTDRLPIEQGAQQPIRDIAIHPRAPDTVYLLHERAGVLVSADGGDKWRLLGKPGETEYPSFTAMAVVFDPQPIIVAGIRDEGAWRYAIR